MIQSLEERHEILQGYLDLISSSKVNSPFGSMLRSYGRAMNVGQHPVGVRFGAMKQCFQNAANLALDDSRFTYVEGLAFHFIPVHHAWCMDKDGLVVDPTWQDARKCAYFGIPIQTSELAKRVAETGVWCLFDVSFFRDGLHDRIEQMIA